MDESRSARAARLRALRLEAGYATAADAARAIGVKDTTYVNHENGNAGLTRNAERYARFFKVSLDWLLSGRGERRPGEGARRAIRFDGFVGAGASIDATEEAKALHEVAIETPGDDAIAALIVRGDSQWPRFLDGEVILYDPRPVLPQTLLGGYAIVDTGDGDRLIKTVERRLSDNLWRLASHNAGPRDAEIVAAFRYLGVLAPTDATRSAAAPGEKAAPAPLIGAPGPRRVARRPAQRI